MGQLMQLMQLQIMSKLAATIGSEPAAPAPAPAPAPWPEDYAAYLEWKAAKARGEKPPPPEDDELVYLPPTQESPDKQVPGESAGEEDY